jgi:hypothetical protein
MHLLEYECERFDLGVLGESARDEDVGGESIVSFALKGHVEPQWDLLMREAIMGYQWSSAAVIMDAPDEGGNHGSSDVIRRHQTSSDVIRRHQSTA